MVSKSWLNLDFIAYCTILFSRTGGVFITKDKIKLAFYTLVNLANKIFLLVQWAILWKLIVNVDFLLVEIFGNWLELDVNKE